jgi:signal transduction histidine kinase
MAGKIGTGRGRWARRGVVRDGTLTGGLLAATLPLSHPQQWPGALWWVATGLLVVAMVLRNRRPVTVLVVCTLSVAVHLAQGPQIALIDGSVLVALYTVAARRPRFVSLAALAGLLLVLACWSGYYALRGLVVPGLPVLAFHTHGPSSATDRTPVTNRGEATGAVLWSGPIALGSALFAGWAVGSGSRSRRDYLDQLRERARDLERERDQRAALAVAAERGRISREMHDVVAHGLSLIVIQAQGAAAALDDYPAETRAALAAIVHSGRASLTDMRRVLEAMGEVDDAWHPQPGLAQVPTLLEQVRQAGIGVQLRVDGDPAPLPAPVDLSAYRIVQEALTNVMKHAGAGSSAEVLLSYRDTAVDIEVGDDGTATSDSVATDCTESATGNGLRGMRERVRLLGGRFTAGPGIGAGFRVNATLPIRTPRA